MVLNDQQKIGALLTGFGIFFTFIGVLALFDRGLLAIGNLLFLSGVCVGLGITKTGKFFFQKRKLKGTACFMFGIFLVIIGWAFIGLMVEIFGFINLFGDFFPIAFAFARKIPIFGPIINIICELPIIKPIVDKAWSTNSLPI
eukprot:TRINITY_DN4665_c0_g1_i1.p1 TRINITY_DN4665_c0_g1~~TRINITY_DN4665_c0_g1_i1.p1  ORF type:complete len:143 (+),score=18.08 TRINITY_DN4665_c0_g1_i1:80-508(+)